jgi:protein-S-isoprenylcysteine O-methyltransferase Ste14
MFLFVLAAAAMNFVVFTTGSLVIFRKSGGSTLLNILTFSIMLFSVVNFYVLGTSDVSDLAALIGTAIALSSIAMFVWAGSHARRYQFSRVFGAHASDGFVRTGPYRYIRHPFYASYLLFWLVFPVAAGHWGPALILVVMFAIYRHAALAEEAVLQQTYPEYRAYAAATDRFFPLFLLHLRRPRSPAL